MLLNNGCVSPQLKQVVYLLTCFKLNLASFLYPCESGQLMYAVGDAPFEQLVSERLFGDVVDDDKQIAFFGDGVNLRIDVDVPKDDSVVDGEPHTVLVELSVFGRFSHQRPQRLTRSWQQIAQRLTVDFGRILLNITLPHAVMAQQNMIRAKQRNTDWQIIVEQR